jgi:DNA modification methylase
MADYNIIEGDVLAVLAGLPAASVQCVVTSPPYWGLRDYGAEGQIGLEPSLDEFVAKMVAVFAEVRRVLRDDGTLWLNLGDSYAQNGRAKTAAETEKNIARASDRGYDVGSWGASRGSAEGFDRARNTAGNGLKPKDLCGVPWRVALALQADGWWLRSDIIWSKPNPMPESCTDRPTKAHEYLFLLTKSARYYYDAEAVKIPVARYDYGKISSGNKGNLDARSLGGSSSGNEGNGIPIETSGKANLRTVWHIPTQPYAEAHFATYPMKLVEPCVKAGTSEKGCCPECGTPWVRVVDTIGVATRPDKTSKYGSPEDDIRGGSETLRTRVINTTTTTGWSPGCGCEWRPRDVENKRPAPPQPYSPIPCVVLDPFCGSGTTGLVACQHDRRFIGIELNPTYAALARKRIAKGMNPATYRDQDNHDGPLFTMGDACRGGPEA